MFIARLHYLPKWTLLTTLVGILSGTASALFLLSLEFVTSARETHPWFLYLLPLSGLLIVFLYSRYGRSVEGGNNLILEQIHDPKETIPFRMTPLVWAGTLLTHLCGGSAGREGTAVQMGGSLADQLTKYFALSADQRRMLLMTGIAGGFASVFGTPLAGMIFGIEVLTVGRLQYKALLPCAWSAIVAHFVCLTWGVHHTVYTVDLIPSLAWSPLLSSLVAGLLFGVCAWIFVQGHHFWGAFFKKHFGQIYLRVFLGGALIVLATLLLDTHRYLGLGVPVIVESFQHPSASYDFLLKILFTWVTLSTGFKGGEVTPLFFIGATLGSALSLWLPLSTSLLAAMGFVAVFAGAANTPLACIFMGIELFGPSAGFYTAIAVLISFVLSGSRGIYHSQKHEMRKYA